MIFICTHWHLPPSDKVGISPEHRALKTHQYPAIALHHITAAISRTPQPFHPGLFRWQQINGWPGTSSQALQITAPPIAYKSIAADRRCNFVLHPAHQTKLFELYINAYMLLVGLLNITCTIPTQPTLGGQANSPAEPLSRPTCLPDVRIARSRWTGLVRSSSLGPGLILYVSCFLRHQPGLPLRLPCIGLHCIALRP